LLANERNWGEVTSRGMDDYYYYVDDILPSVVRGKVGAAQKVR
jgi:hypothetical protein